MRNIQYSIELSVHKQPSVFNTTYTIQSRVNCLKYILQMIYLCAIIYNQQVKEDLVNFSFY